MADLRTWCRTHITCDWKVQEGSEETDEIDEQSGGRENWVVLVAIAAFSDAQLMLFTMEFVGAVVKAGEGMGRHTVAQAPMTAPETLPRPERWEAENCKGHCQGARDVSAVKLSRQPGYRLIQREDDAKAGALHE